MPLRAQVWASVFHSRDKPLTEAVDYHSATAVQISGLGAASARVLQVCVPANCHFASPLAFLLSSFFPLPASRFPLPSSASASASPLLSASHCWALSSLVQCLFSKPDGRRGGNVPCVLARAGQLGCDHARSHIWLRASCLRPVGGRSSASTRRNVLRSVSSWAVVEAFIEF